MIKTNRIHINGLPFEFALSTQIIISRGWQPSEFHFLITEPGKWKALENPVTIRVRTDDGGGVTTELNLKNWYITEIAPHSSGMWEVTIKDMRWALMNKTFVAAWNIETPDGETRNEKKTEAKSKPPVTCIQAAQEALELLGEVDPVIEVDPALQRILLPKNMGDSDAAGYVAGTLKTVDQFLELCRCDMIPNAEGKLVLTDRFTDKTAALKQTPKFDGHVAVRDIHWTKPKNIIMTFEQRIERPFQVNLSSADQSVVDDSPYDLICENVVPNFDIFALPALREDGSPVVDWVFLPDYVTNYCGYASYADFLKKRFKPTGVPLPKNPTGAERVLASIYRRRENIARTALFSTWKVDFDQSGIGRNWFDVRLGRLHPKGVTLPSGYVFLDYSEFARYDVDPGGNVAPVEKIYNQKHLYDITLEAPFEAHWISDGNTALVFKINVGVQGLQDAQYLPGLLDPDIQFGNIQDVAGGKPIIAGDQVEMLPKFRMRVFWSGLLATNLIREGQKIDRLYSIKKVGFAAGEVESITIHSKNVTANWGFQDGIAFPGVLLNGPELEDRAKNIAKQIEEAFKDAKSGVVIASGVKHLTKTWPGGNIYSAAIEVGMETEWSINTRYEVIPEVRSTLVENPKDLDGRKPQAIG